MPDTDSLRKERLLRLTVSGGFGSEWQERHDGAIQFMVFQVWHITVDWKRGVRTEPRHKSRQSPYSSWPPPAIPGSISKISSFPKWHYQLWNNKPHLLSLRRNILDQTVRPFTRKLLLCTQHEISSQLWAQDVSGPPWVLLCIFHRKWTLLHCKGSAVKMVKAHSWGWGAPGCLASLGFISFRLSS